MVHDVTLHPAFEYQGYLSPALIYNQRHIIQNFYLTPLIVLLSVIFSQLFFNFTLKKNIIQYLNSYTVILLQTPRNNSVFMLLYSRLISLPAVSSFTNLNGLSR